MIKLYKDLYIKYFISAMLGAIVIIFAGNFIFPTLSIITLFLPAIVYICGCMIFFVSIASKRYSKTINHMQAECQCQLFLDEINATTKKSMRLSTNIKTFLSINIAVAYLNMGNADEFRRIMDEIDVDKMKSKTSKSNAKFAIALNNATYYLFVNDKQNAEQKLTLIKEMLDNPDFKAIPRDKILRAVERVNAHLYLLDEDYEKAEAIYLYNAEFGTTKLIKVFANYFLGVIYTHENRIDDAKDAYEYTIVNGGDTYCVPLAKEALARL